MNKYVYVIEDELSHEIVNTFIANNDDVAKIVVERSLEKIPMFGDVSLHNVAFLIVDNNGVRNVAVTNIYKPYLVKTYFKPKEKKSKRR